MARNCQCFVTMPCRLNNTAEVISKGIKHYVPAQQCAHPHYSSTKASLYLAATKMSTSLIAAQAPESGQRVHLHPLVLLTASDLITRYRVRALEGPIAGILLGQQQGTEITAEYAFTAKLKNGLLDQTEDWTARRIEQCRHQLKGCDSTY